MPYDALQELIALTGLPEKSAERVEIVGNDPVIPCAYQVGAAEAAVQAAIGIAASELWSLQSGRQQTVRIDVSDAVASLRNSKYLQIDGAPPKRPGQPLGGFYELKDGRWFYLHCGFPHIRDNNIRILDATADRESVAAAIKKWDGLELEEALVAGTGCGGFVRSAEEWNRHPQAQAITTLPILEITRIGDAPPEPLPTSDRPLGGVRVLDLTRVVAGPTCARTLAEHGADVLKIARQGLPDSGIMELDTGVGKLSAYLDLREPDATQRLKDLVQSGDVFSQSYRPGTLAARGFGPEELAELRPGIVYVTLSAWGHDGPWKHRRGYDTVVQSANGIAESNSDGGQPKNLPIAAQDYISGHLMALGAMVALLRRATEGGSWFVRVSLATTGHWFMRRGLLAPGQYAGLPAEFSADRIERLYKEIQAPDGLIRYLGPVLQLSETPPHLTRPPVPLGYHSPEWPESPSRHS